MSSRHNVLCRVIVLSCLYELIYVPHKSLLPSLSRIEAENTAKGASNQPNKGTTYPLYGSRSTISSVPATSERIQLSDTPLEEQIRT